MVTVSQVAKKIIENQPSIQDALIEGIINFANLAEKLKPKIEKELGKKIKQQAVVMALRRFSETLKKKTIPNIPSLLFTSEIIMKTDLSDVTVVKTPSAIDRIKTIQNTVNYQAGDTLNVVQGNYEITFIISQKHLSRLKKLLSGEKILNIEKNLVSLTLRLAPKFMNTPGVLSVAVRKLAWENINILENISTLTELIFIVSEKDAVRSYNAFSEMVRPKAME